ncbi:transcriptional repressor LexA [Dehalobacterium formicoaceticum]|uniref:LexA repressor n=1 Tax=Dehalobacterium formicoaceticum TaxID=51515 RepID=A0ABT1Y4Z2_9FIRM|nr:transcriptional repressor LexA [Dehalobacterium formicoaceticum]MCR6545944.1 transcriptional repressor LexA [Dehalobacterium formicoaceticum]
MYEDLSKRQIEILDYIKQEIKTKGYPPTVREIGHVVGLSSSSTVHGHLTVLEQKGYIRRDPTKPRAIEITDGSYIQMQREMVNIPIIGKITAGLPILAVENVEEHFPVPLDFINAKNELFMLHVSGESMIEAGILDGDYVIVEKTDIAGNGDIVAALIDDEATIKRFFKEKDHIRLQPENRFLPPIIVNDVKILGRVIGLFRAM